MTCSLAGLDVEADVGFGMESDAWPCGAKKLWADECPVFFKDELATPAMGAH